MVTLRLRLEATASSVGSAATSAVWFACRLGVAQLVAPHARGDLAVPNPAIARRPENTNTRRGLTAQTERDLAATYRTRLKR